MTPETLFKECETRWPGTFLGWVEEPYVYIFNTKKKDKAVWAYPIDELKLFTNFEDYVNSVTSPEIEIHDKFLIECIL